MVELVAFEVIEFVIEVDEDVDCIENECSISMLVHSMTGIVLMDDVDPVLENDFEMNNSSEVQQVAAVVQRQSLADCYVVVSVDH